MTARSRRGRPQKTWLADHTHGRHQRRIASAIAGRLDMLLGSDERVLSFTEAVEQEPLLGRAVLGAAWAASCRVAIVLTQSRLLEIGVSAGGRRAVGRLRSFPWDQISAIQIDGPWFELRTWQDETFCWFLHDELETDVRSEVESQVTLAISTYQPTDTRPTPMVHCTGCGSDRTSVDGPCRACGALQRSPRLAGWLAAALAGSGHAYSGRWLAALFRFTVEAVVYIALAWSVVSASKGLGAFIAVVAALSVITLLNIQGIVAARRLAARAPAISVASAKRWRWVVPVGALLTATTFLVPLGFIGEADRAVSWDLELVHTDDTWSGSRLRSQWTKAARDADMRSEWHHLDGRVVRIRARPLDAFEQEPAARRRLTADTGTFEELQLGPHRALQTVEETTSITGESVLLIRLHLIDAAAHDSHSLTIIAPVAEEAAAEARLHEALRRAVWIPAIPPRDDPSGE